MKKQTALTVALALALGVGAQAVASAAPYNDVPSSAKQAVDKLYKDGLLDNRSAKFGPSDRVTRVEMAKLVAEAMTKLEKADAQQKAMIKKLAAEFKPELDALKADVDGVKGDINTINGRLDGVEKRLAEKQNVQFNGYYRARFENLDKSTAVDGPNAYMNRVRLDMTAPLDGNFAFHGRYEFNSNSTGTFDTGSVNMTQAYVAGRMGDLDLVAMGRMPLALGQGLLIDSNGGNDAFAVGFGKDLKVVLGTARVDNFVIDQSVTTYFANLSTKVAPNTTMSASYLKDNGSNLGLTGLPLSNNSTAYKSTAVGFNYTGFENVTVTGEYGQNDSALAKLANDNKKAKAWMAQVKFKGADKAQVGTFGIWAGYRSVDPAFDALNLTTLDSADVADNSRLNFWSANNSKGFEYGVEYTAFKNGVFTLKYLPLKEKTTVPALGAQADRDHKQFIGQLEVFF